MQTIWETLSSPPVLLAFIPLAMALAVFTADMLGWSDPPSSRGDSGCRCGHGAGL
jgi:hypothetical protein